MTAELGAGLLQALSGRLSLRVDATAEDPSAFTEQLGLGQFSLTPGDAPMRGILVLAGTAVNANGSSTSKVVTTGSEYLTVV